MIHNERCAICAYYAPISEFGGKCKRNNKKVGRWDCCMFCVAEDGEYVRYYGNVNQSYQRHGEK